MLSILIPTFNYNIIPLVSKIVDQLKKETIAYEVVVADDYSTDRAICIANQDYLNKVELGRFLPLKNNIGRSAIRNLLAEEALYQNLLFLDADVLPKWDSFIKKYIQLLDTNYEIIYGGIVYQEQKPEKNQLLRWKYGNAREAVSVKERSKRPYINFLTLNFLIKKEVSKRLRFNEEIPNLRCEDTLFSMDAKNKKIKVDHVDNVVVHLGLETSKIFLKKSLESIEVRQGFLNDALLETDYTKITWLANRIQKLNLGFIFPPFYKISKSFFEKNLLSDSPSMFCFDLYRLGYYFYYEKNNFL